MFSGRLGLDLALRIAVPTCRVVALLEGEAACVAAMAADMEAGRVDPAPICTDVCEFDGREWAGKVDLVFGGFPCTDISNAGKREGIVEGNRSGLWFEMARSIREVGPRFVFLENVAAVTVRGIDTVLGNLAEMGFDAEWGSLEAGECGASQKRKRWFCLGWRRVADAGDAVGRRNGKKWGQEGSAVVGRAGEVVDDATSPRCERRECESSSASRDETRVRESGGRCDDVGNAIGTGAGTERRSDRGQRREPADAHESTLVRQAHRPDGTGRIAATSEVVGDSESLRRCEAISGQPPRPGYFPPGPGDADAWRRVLADRPDLAPAIESGIRGVVAGASGGVGGRIDHLRALGNLVVPISGAVAFALLWERAFGERI